MNAQEKNSNPHNLSLWTITLDNLINMLYVFNKVVLQTTGMNWGLPDDHIEHAVEDVLAKEITS